MAVLPNPLWERFAALIVEGTTNVHLAFIAAGLTPETATCGWDLKASRLIQNPAVILRLRELQQEKARIVAERTGIDAAWVIERLMGVYEECMGIRACADHRMRWNPQAGLRALELIGKHLGMFTERAHVVFGREETISIIRRMDEEQLHLLAKYGTSERPAAKQLNGKANGKANGHDDDDHTTH